MTFTLIANIATILLCGAVTIQSLRMMRSLNAVKEGNLAQVVSALDQSTMQARIVLSELKGTLKRCSESSDAVMRGDAITEELRMMVDLADASAERLARASAASPARAEEKPAKTAKPARAAAKTTRARRQAASPQKAAA